jgi:hypothetical protein
VRPQTLAAVFALVFLTSAAGNRLAITVPTAQQSSADTDILVTAHVDDVEALAGQSSDATEIDRSQSICK